MYGKKSKPLRLLLLLLVTILSSCATTAKYEENLNELMGKSESDLIRIWGAPDNIYTTEVSKYLTFNKSGSVFVPGVSPSIQTTIIGNTAFTNVYGGSPSMNITLNCKTTFELKNGFVTSWRWEGNSCKSK